MNFRSRSYKMLMRNLAVLSYAQGFTVWVYTCDNLAKALAPDYFLSACDMLQALDLIVIRSKPGVAIRFVATCTETSVILEKLL
jgi:hypothetical protein